MCTSTIRVNGNRWRRSRGLANSFGLGQTLILLARLNGAILVESGCMLMLHECPRFGRIVYVAPLFRLVYCTICFVWTFEKLEIWGKRGGETRGGWTNQIAFDETEHVGRMEYRFEVDPKTKRKPSVCFFVLLCDDHCQWKGVILADRRASCDQIT